MKDFLIQILMVYALQVYECFFLIANDRLLENNTIKRSHWLGLGYVIITRANHTKATIFFLPFRPIVRAKAIGFALWFGLLPWYLYEKEKHYKESYTEHLLINLLYALRWLTWSEKQSDVQFERTTNDNY